MTTDRQEVSPHHHKYTLHIYTYADIQTEPGLKVFTWVEPTSLVKDCATIEKNSSYSLQTGCLPGAAQEHNKGCTYILLKQKHVILQMS